MYTAMGIGMSLAVTVLIFGTMTILNAGGIYLSKGNGIMDLETYAIEARKTAVFNPIYHVTYPALGLVDETAEFVEKLAQVKVNSRDLAKEAGDCLWYFNCVCDYSGLRITDFFKYEVIAEPLDLMITAGKIAGVAKKAARDNAGQVNKERMSELLQNYAAAFLNILYVALYDYSLEEIMEMNIVKLRDRQNRGVLKGDGDHR